MKIIIRPKVEITDEILMILTFGGSVSDDVPKTDYEKEFLLLKSDQIEMEKLYDEVFIISEIYEVIQFRYPIEELEKYYTIEQI